MSKPQPPSITASPSSQSAPLSNAERQRRWRERLKAKAAGAAVTDHVRDVVARAILALWACHERPAPGGARWADIDGCRTIEDYVFDLAAEEHGLTAAARAFLPGFEGLTPEEARAIAELIDLTDVIALRDRREKGLAGGLLAAAESRLTLVPQAATDVLELDSPLLDAAPEPEPGRVIGLTAARRARRRGLTRKWQ